MIEERGDYRSTPPSVNVEAVCCFATAIVLVSIFNLLFLFRFVPLSEGWFSVYANQINHGAKLYRDVYFFLPPFYPWLIAAITRCFGYDLIVLRVFGLGVILVLTATMFGILRRFVSPVIAMMATVIAVLYYQSGNAHITYDFIQIMNASALLGCLCLLKVAECPSVEGVHARAARSWAVLAGTFCGLACYTKHSNGAFVVLFSGFAAVYADFLSSKRWRVFTLVWYVTGFGLVSVVLGCILAATGSFFPAIQMLTGGAAAAKGGLGTALFAFFFNTFDVGFVMRVLSLIVLAWGLGYFSRRWTIREFRPPGRRPWTRWWPFWLLATCGLLMAILIPWYRAGGVPGWIVAALSNEITLNMIPFAVTGTLAVLLIPLFNHRSTTLAVGSLVIPALVSAGMLWGNGTSGGLSEAGAFLGFAFAFSILVGHGGWMRAGGIALSVVLMMQISILAEVKYRAPYAWWGLQSSDARGRLEAASLPMLHGMYLSRAENKLFNDITHIIATETAPGDRILVFPQTPIFYLLGDRQFPGKAVVHWFDFLPDSLARDEAALIRQSPPALIIMLEMPDSVWRTHETLFRAGKPSGQREIVRAVSDLEASGLYADLATIGISPGYNYRIWKRK